jgi:hypothetical protein
MLLPRAVTSHIESRYCKHMRLITLSLLAVTLWSGVAVADRDRDHRDDRHDRRDNRRDNYRDNRRDTRHTVRDNRVRRQRYRGTVRANRRVIVRRPLYTNNGRFTFHTGRTVVYQRPIIRERYYNVRVRPQVIVENYPSQDGYIWVSGQWTWGGSEWQWQGGHYEPDPAYSNYYDDGSYEISAGYEEDGDGY